MKRQVVVSLLILAAAAPLAGAALVAPFPEPLADQAPAAAEPVSFPPLRAGREPVTRDLLLGSDPARWLPVLARTGSVREAAAAISAFPGDDAPEHFLEPLGDANGDGVDDLLLHKRTYDEWGNSLFSVSALAGGTFAAIWTYDVPLGAYAYALGDVTGDGVVDVVAIADEDSAGDATYVPLVVGGAFHWEGATTVHLTLLTGATGRPHYARDVTLDWAYDAAYAGSFAPYADTYAYADLFRFRFGYAFLSALDGAAAGANQVAIEASYDSLSTGTYSYPADEGATAWLFRWIDSFRIQRLDGDGRVVWESSADLGPTGVYWLDDRDFTGDGVPDLLFTNDPWSLFLYREALGGSDWDGLDELSATRASLLDGSTGQLAWDVSHPPRAGSGFGFVSVAGRVDGPERDVFLTDLERGAAGGWSARVTRVDGATGVAQDVDRSTSPVRVPFGFGDADRDGLDELLVLRVPDALVDSWDPAALDGLVTSIEELDGRVLWSVTGAEAGFPCQYCGDWVGDLDGDGVPEALFFRLDAATLEPASLDARGGEDGVLLWSLSAAGARLLGLDFVGDVTGDGGRDLVTAVVDAPPGVSEPDDHSPYPIHVDLRAGADASLVWSAALHDPVTSSPVTIRWPYAFFHGAGDVNGDGSGDVLVVFRSFTNWGEDPNPKLSFVEAVSGATGSTLLRYDGA